ncbi:hypothetical protein BHM03_00049516 [Ensete ventricosum]|nr:hypothetical protein BHM03_00049516 [Ensete ventricosum]
MACVMRRARRRRPLAGGAMWARGDPGRTEPRIWGRRVSRRGGCRRGWSQIDQWEERCRVFEQMIKCHVDLGRCFESVRLGRSNSYTPPTNPTPKRRPQ